MLLWRVITALCLIPLVLFLIIKTDLLAFSLLSAAFLGLGAWEWANLSHCTQNEKWAYVLIFFLALGVISFFPPSFILSLGSLSWLFPLYWVITFKGEKIHPLNAKLPCALLGIFYLSVAWFALNYLKALAFGPQWIILLCLLVWSADTFAYFAGRQWGRKALAPLVSPKKTLAGFWGGVAGTLFTAVVVFIVFQTDALSPIKPPLLQGTFLIIWFLLAGVIVLLSVVGDLFESLLKRLANVKDSGTLLPGHGGILDRIDSLIAALPFYAFLLFLAGA